MQNIDATKAGEQHTGPLLKIPREVAGALQQYVSWSDYNSRPDSMKFILSVMAGFNLYQILSASKSTISDVYDTDKDIRSAIKFANEIDIVTNGAAPAFKKVVRALSSYVEVSDRIISGSEKGYASFVKFVEACNETESFSLKDMKTAYAVGLHFINIKTLDQKAEEIQISTHVRASKLSNRIEARVLKIAIDSLVDLLYKIEKDIEDMSDVFIGNGTRNFHDALREMGSDILSLKTAYFKVRQIEIELNAKSTSSIIRKDVENESVASARIMKYIEAQNALKLIDRKFGNILEPLSKPVRKYSHKNPSGVKSLLSFIDAPTELAGADEFAEVKRQAGKLVSSFSFDSLGLKPKVVKKAIEKVGLLSAMSYDEVKEFKDCRDKLTELENEIGTDGNLSKSAEAVTNTIEAIRLKLDIAVKDRDSIEQKLNDDLLKNFGFEIDLRKQ